MQYLIDLHEQILSLGKQIDANLNEICRLSNSLTGYGAKILTDWQVYTTSETPLALVERIKILGPKTDALIREREEKYKEYLAACYIEKDNQLQRARAIGIPDWWIQKQGEVNVPQESKIKIPHIVILELKEKIDELETVAK